MQILLASAKIMRTATTAGVPSSSRPHFEAEAKALALELSQWEPQALSAAFHCSTAIAVENLRRYQSFFEPSEQLPAVLAYNGQAYKYLRADDFSADDFTFAQQHLLITSFLYGLLRPLDLIHPYRLEGKTRLPATDGQTLFDYWKPRLTGLLIEQVKADDGILVHLATEEFQHLFDWKRILRELTVVQPLFYVQRAGLLKVLSVHAKSCRGAMARHILRHRLSVPEDLHAFSLNGFEYKPDYGDTLHPHFILTE